METKDAMVVGHITLYNMLQKLVLKLNHNILTLELKEVAKLLVELSKLIHHKKDMDAHN
jgi:hypothetical protein